MYVHRFSSFPSFLSSLFLLVLLFSLPLLSSFSTTNIYWIPAPYQTLCLVEPDLESSVCGNQAPLRWGTRSYKEL